MLEEFQQGTVGLQVQVVEVLGVLEVMDLAMERILPLIMAMVDLVEQEV
tara:strand:+ start:183 stop:329 length:147 start_codon:yes stop_codon:yes gene_type:complete